MKQNNIRISAAVATVAGILCSAGAAYANVTYTYTGHLFTTSDQPAGVTGVSGSFTIASPLAANIPIFGAGSAITPLSISFTDGLHTSMPFGGGDTLWMGTDAGGSIRAWQVGMAAACSPADPPSCTGVTILSLNRLGSIQDEAFAANSSFNVLWDAVTFSDPGVWTVSTASEAPEPSSVMLFAGGFLLIALATFLRRKALA